MNRSLEKAQEVLDDEMAPVAAVSDAEELGNGWDD